jgi:hypothetical protein
LWVIAAFSHGSKRRIEYPGAFYHVMDRGDRRELSFKG